MLSVAGVCFTAVPAKVAGTSCFHVQLVMKDLATGEQQEGGRQTAALVVTRDRGSVSPMVALIEHPWSQPSCSRVHKTGAGQSSDHTSLSRVNPVTCNTAWSTVSWHPLQTLTSATHCGSSDPLLQKLGTMTTPAQCSDAAELCCSLAPNSRGREWLECKSVIHEENTQLHTHVKARNSLTSGYKPTTNFLYAQVIPYLFVLGVLVPFPQASGVCLS